MNIRLSRSLRLVAVTAAVAACESAALSSGPVPTLVVEPSAVLLGVGDSARLQATTADGRQPIGAVQFVRAGSTVQVDRDGLVRGLVPGRTTVTVVAPELDQTFTIPAVVRGIELRLGGQTVTGAGLVLAPAQTLRLAGTVYGLPRGADGTLRWTSSDTAVLAVSREGGALTRLAGRATLTAVSTVDSTLRRSVTVDVSPLRGRAALRLSGIGGGTFGRSLPPDSLRGTVTVSVLAEPRAFPPGARVELTLGGRPAGERALSGQRTLGGAPAPLTFRVPTAGHDSAAPFPGGERSLVVRVVGAGGATVGRLEQPVVVRNP